MQAFYKPQEEPLIVEPYYAPGTHAGRVFACIYPHSDDFSLYSAGLMAKLLREGYTGYLIRLTNDMMDSENLSPGATMHHIEGDMDNLCRTLGIAKRFDLNYMNHYLTHSQLPELRHRLITIFRYYNVDTVISLDPSGHYEENPDHYICAMAVEQACWMAECRLDLPELYDMGMKPAHITRKYYKARGPQLVNRVIDIEPVLQAKHDALMCNTAPITNMLHGYQRAGRDYKDLDDFVTRHFCAPKEPIAGVKHWEIYHYIGD